MADKLIPDRSASCERDKPACSRRRLIVSPTDPAGKVPTVEGMVNSVRGGGRRYPGNKRQRGARLVFGTGENQLVAAPKERAAVFGALPLWWLLEGLRGDEAFVGGLESVLAADLSADALAARYQRRGSNGYRVILSLVESALQPAIAGLVERERSEADVRFGLRAQLGANGAVAFAPRAAVAQGDRQRWRNPDWRRRAIDALLAMGAGRCLAEECGEPADGSRYCEHHAEHQRNPASTPQSNPEAAQARHDALVASVSDLLREVGALLDAATARRTQSIAVPLHGH
jgi:hypothetical protein